ncbi:MAG TPA: DUF4430 domain-containing protein [Vicinamibacteria bacterium]
MRRLAQALACGLALAGCGLGEGAKRPGAGAELRVTRDFGRVEVGEARLARVSESATVMRLLRSRFRVDTSYGGRFVQSIDGLAGGGRGGRVDWFYWVNGIEADKGAAEYALSPGDRVQWDRRDWRATMRVPAIVGAFPEPFVHGFEGKRRPVRLECAEPGGGACATVKSALERRGVSVSGSTLGAPNDEKVIRVVVAPWRRARLVRAAAALEQGPQRSGVFARFDPAGSSLTLLDGKGRLARRLRPGAGTGIVAATRGPREELVWLVTAIDRTGLEAAANALDQGKLRDAFAVAATGRSVEPLPLTVRR